MPFFSSQAKLSPVWFIRPVSLFRKEILDDSTISIGGLNISPCGLMRTSPTYQTTLLVESRLSIFGGGFKLRCFQLLPAAA